MSSAPGSWTSHHLATGRRNLDDPGPSDVRAEDKDVIISTTILSWNRADLLERTLYSYRDTVSVPYELFIVDNGSEDGSVEVIERFCKETSTARALLVGANYGGVALNLGIVRSRASLIHLSDNDVEYLPGWCDYVVEVFNRLPLLGQLSLFGPSPSDEEVWEHPFPLVPWYENGALIYEAPTSNVPTTSVLRRSVFGEGAKVGDAPRLVDSKIRFPGDAGLSETVRARGLRVAWAERYLVKNLGDSYEEMRAREAYYAATYGSKPWLGVTGWKQRMARWRAAPRPDRTSAVVELLDAEAIQPELSLSGEDATSARCWSMVDARTPPLEVLEFVHSLVRMQKPGLVVEPRAWRGHCSVAIGRALSRNDEGRAVCMEEDSAAFELVLDRLAKAGTKRVQPLPLAARSWIPDDTVDMLVFDCYGLSIDEVRVTLRHYIPQLAEGATVVFLSTERVVASNAVCVLPGGMLGGFELTIESVALRCPRGVEVVRIAGRSQLGGSRCAGAVSGAENV